MRMINFIIYPTPKKSNRFSTRKQNKKAAFNTMLENVEELLEILNLVACDCDAINIREWYRLKLEEVVF